MWLTGILDVGSTPALGHRRADPDVAPRMHGHDVDRVGGLPPAMPIAFEKSAHDGPGDEGIGARRSAVWRWAREACRC